MLDRALTQRARNRNGHLCSYCFFSPQPFSGFNLEDLSAKSTANASSSYYHPKTAKAKALRTPPVRSSSCMGSALVLASMLFLRDVWLIIQLV